MVLHACIATWISRLVILLHKLVIIMLIRDNPHALLFFSLFDSLSLCNIQLISSDVGEADSELRHSCRRMLGLHGDIVHALPKASLCLMAKWSEVTVSYFIRLLPLLRFPPSPITGHPAASPTAVLKCLKAFSASAILWVCLFTILLCLSFIQPVTFFLFCLYICFLLSLHDAVKINH